MRSRPLLNAYRGLLAPLALLALVGLLGTLQYRWLGQVSDAEREQLRSSLDRRAREFGADFDREITRLYQALQPAIAFDPDAPAAFLRVYDDWSGSVQNPGLVKAVYIAKAKPPAFSLHHFDPDARTFAVEEWPASLDAVRRRITGASEEGPVNGSAKTKIVTFTTSPIVVEVPALVIPMPLAAGAMAQLGPHATVDHDFLMAIRLSHSYLVVELNADYLKNELLPALIARHFSESGSIGYRVAVVDVASETVVSRNLSAGERIQPARADVTAPFFTVRPEIVRSATLTWTAPIGPGTAGRSMIVRPLGSITSDQVAVRMASPAGTPVSGPAGGVGAAGQMTSEMKAAMITGHWRLLVQHSAGSLDAAVDLARRHNMMLSFGILAVLAASMGLIVVNARRSERLASQQMDFVATVSHELRTPLAVIRSAAQNLSAGVVHEPGQAMRYGQLIEDEGQRLTEMVEQVLEYAGLEENRRQAPAKPVDLGGLTSEVVSSSLPLFEAAGMELSASVADDVPQIVGDEGAIRRALHNLLTNALKYATAGRSVRVDVQPASTRGDREVQIAVTDRGPGIPAEELPHIFEPFYRGRNASERQIHGNGLGLSLVKRIAEAHGGRVSVRSSEGGPDTGATFTIHLPAASAG
jgi:signal transduction histidine kinase